jgi:hypothetical protein
MKIRLDGAELFHADRQTDRQTDMTKLIFAFRNFANAPKIPQYIDSNYEDSVLLILKVSLLPFTSRHDVIFFFLHSYSAS